MNPNEQIDRTARSGGIAECSSALRGYIKRSRAHYIRRAIKRVIRQEDFDAADIDPRFKGYLS